MALAALVERALLLRGSGGGSLCNQTQVQTFIPAFEASGIQTISVSPPIQSYAAIAYEFSIDSDKAWNWTVSLRAYGVPAIDMTLVPGPRLQQTLSMWIVTTDRNTLEIQVTNRDNLVRSFACTTSFLAIPSVNDLAELMARLDAPNNSCSTGALNCNTCAVPTGKRLCIGSR